MKTRACHCCDGSGKEIDDVALGAYLRNLRVGAGVTGRAMAQKLKISPSYLCDLEGGKRRWTESMSDKYLKQCLR